MESSKTCETFSCAHLIVLRWLYAMCVLAFSLSSDVQSLKEFKPLTVPAVWKKHLNTESTCDTLTIQNNPPTVIIIIISSNVCLTALHVILFLICFQSHLIISNVLKITAMSVFTLNLVFFCVL